MNVIRDTNAGGNIGEAFGTGLGQGLQMLAHNKLNQIQQQNQQRQIAQGLKSLFPNIKSDELNQIAGLPSDLLNTIVKQKSQEMSNMDFANALGQGQQQTQSFPLEQQSQESNIIQPQAKSLSTLNRYEDILRNPKLKPDQRLKIEKLAQQERLAERKENRELRKESLAETKEAVHKYRADYRDAKNVLEDTDRMIELEKEKKLDTPGYVEFLKRSGLDIPALMNEGSEEYSKIQQSFLRDAKQYFGGRVSNYEVEQFLKTIPSLSQSPEGRKRVMSNLRRFARLKTAYYKSYRDIIGKPENKGIRPLNLEDQVEDEVDKLQKQLSNAFKKDLERPVPKGQNKLITALQAGIGSATKPLAGAALGFALGGPVGAGIGGLGGLGVNAIQNALSKSPINPS